MAVKDFVEIYNNPYNSTPRSTSRASATESLQPAPARFINHSGKHDVTHSHSISTSSLVHAPDSTFESTLDITDLSHKHEYISNVGHRYQNHEHTPIAATTIFSREAPPLYLPKLDNYLASLPSPEFSNYSESENAMFPPMDELAKMNQSLDILETNIQQIPSWRDRKTILGSAVNMIIGLMGSSALASFYSLQGIFNTVQIFALILSTIAPVGGQNLGDKWRKLFLGTIPNVLALNFSSTLVQSLIFLLIFMAIAAVLLYYFHRSTFHDDVGIEGLQQTSPKGPQWTLIIITFILTVIYLPLSTMAVHVLVWSQDLWVVPNPYTDHSATQAASLNTTDAYRDAFDFCWTTTTNKNEVNYAPLIILISLVVFLFLTLWFPIALRHVIKRSIPKVDRFSELGRARSNVEMDGEYHRLLNHDRNPFAFLYSGFRRNWGTYESTYLIAKLSTLIIIAVVDPNNCVFHSFSRSKLLVVRQILLLVSTIGFFLAQCLFAPFLDPVNNASEWTSRLNYVATAGVALAIALNVPGQDILNTYVLYSIYIITYGLSFYFTIINLAFMQRVVKRLTRRIDFSIDIFSPRLDISPSSLHVKRRIWQESITTLLLTRPECAIPKEHPMSFAQARDSEFPPYLLDFNGTPGERHVENLKILKEVGSLTYNKATALVSGPDSALYKRLEHEILKNFIGPDCYWKIPDLSSNPKCTKFFGNAWWIPFPPTLVLQYDDGPLAVLKEVTELEAYISQNSSDDIQRKRLVRMSLRALEGQILNWPYDHISPIGTYSNWRCRGRRYRAISSVHYQSCVLRIKRKGHLLWHDLQLGSGFDIELAYTNDITLAGEAIGINDDYDLTDTLAQFLKINQGLIPDRLLHIEEMLSSYRRHCRKESQWKSRTLSYQFLSFIYDQPQDTNRLARSLANERNPRVQRLIVNGASVFKAAYERLLVVSRSKAATWWYIFWDDLWRRNNDTITELKGHASEFNPHYPTSIAYTPLPRAALESFLVQRGLFSKNPHSTTFFTSGFINKLYLRLNDTIFRESNGAITFHIGDGGTELEMDDVDLETRAQSSTLGTGGGTDHDDSWIRARPTYRWEGILDNPPGRSKWSTKFGAWLGLTPLWNPQSSSVSLDVRLENGRYVILEDL